MTYQRNSRRHRHLLYSKAKKEKVHTGLGHLFNVMRFLGMTRVARLAVRKPWHVADLYVDGRFMRALYIYPKENMAERIARLNREAAEMVEQKRDQTIHKPTRNQKWMQHVSKNTTR